MEAEEIAEAKACDMAESTFFDKAKEIKKCEMWSGDRMEKPLLFYHITATLQGDFWWKCRNKKWDIDILI